MAQILVVDDDKLMHATIRSIFSEDTVVSCFSIEEAKKAIATNTFNVAFLDIQLTETREKVGISLLQEIMDGDNYLACIMMSGLDDQETIVKCLETGALDYIIKGVASPDIFKLAMYKAQVWRKLKSESYAMRDPNLFKRKTPELDSIIGNSKAISQIKSQISKIGILDGPFLILGATGTGKELAARALWSMKANPNRPFIAVNCASLPANLVESELFGYEKGAFTGATATKTGLFEAANGGDIFLDEMGELSLDLQAKLLRVLQEKKVRRLGSDKERPVDFRVIAATNVGLMEAVGDKTFREDLFYRLNVHTLHLPELKSRKEDIILLINFFLGIHGIKNLKLEKDVDLKLLNYHWPGNIRQLRALTEYLRAYLDQKNPTVTMEMVDQWFSFNIPTKKQASTKPIDTEEQLKALLNSKQNMSLVDVLDQLQRSYVESALKLTNQNRSQAAQLLGVSRQRLSNWLSEWQIYE